MAMWAIAVLWTGSSNAELPIAERAAMFVEYGIDVQADLASTVPQLQKVELLEQKMLDMRTHRETVLDLLHNATVPLLPQHTGPELQIPALVVLTNFSAKMLGGNYTCIRDAFAEINTNLTAQNLGMVMVPFLVTTLIPGLPDPTKETEFNYLPTLLDAVRGNDVVSSLRRLSGATLATALAATSPTQDFCGGGLSRYGQEHHTGYSAVAIDCLMKGLYNVLLHEFGHNLRCHHDWATIRLQYPLSIILELLPDGLANNKGFVHQDGDRILLTLMAYPPKPFKWSNVTVVGAFSSPDLIYDGVTLGDSKSNCKRYVEASRDEIAARGEKLNRVLQRRLDAAAAQRIGVPRYSC